MYLVQCLDLPVRNKSTEEHKEDQYMHMYAILISKIEWWFLQQIEMAVNIQNDH